MSEVSPSPSPVGGKNVFDDPRTVTMIVWGCYLASLLLGPAVIVGFVIALMKRGDAAGTVYESHLSKAVQVFLISLVAGVIGVLLTFVFVGFLVLLALAVWFIVVSVKGLMRANDGRAYAET